MRHLSAGLRSSVPAAGARGAGLPLLLAAATAGATAAAAWLGPGNSPNEADTSLPNLPMSSSGSFGGLTLPRPGLRFFGRRISSAAALCEKPIHRHSKTVEGGDNGSGVDVERSVVPPSVSRRDEDRRYELLRPPGRSLAESHAVFGAIKGSGKVERYDVYRRRRRGGVGGSEGADGGASGGGGMEGQEVAVADVRFGHRIDGHDGIVHGGIICLLFDDAMGWGYEAMILSRGELQWKAGEGGRTSSREVDEEEDVPTIVTANLNVDFRTPVPGGTDAIIRIIHDRTEGRKVYFSARMESADGSGTLYSEAKALFIVLRKETGRESADMEEKGK